MFKRICLLVVVNLSLACAVFSQIIDRVWEPNQSLATQNLKFNNGELWISNTLMGDTILRTEYSNCGFIKKQAQIVQELFNDTIVTSNGSEEFIQVHELKRDVLDGEYICFFENGKIKEEGVYFNGFKIGKWKDYFESGEIRNVINYNKKGNKDGPFTVYYKNGQARIKGAYYPVELIEEYSYFSSQTYEPVKIKEIFVLEKLTGSYQVFSKSGILVKEIDYK